jgi:tRNA-dihydrouridine synthase
VCYEKFTDPVALQEHVDKCGNVQAAPEPVQAPIEDITDSAVALKLATEPEEVVVSDNTTASEQVREVTPEPAKVEETATPEPVQAHNKNRTK